MSSLFEALKQAATIFKWWVIVSPWEQALRVRAGKHVSLLTAGVHFLIPFVDSVYAQSVRRRVATLQMQTITCADGRTLTVGASLGYSIQDIRLLYDTLHHAQDTVMNIASQAIAKVVTETAGIAPDRLGADASKLLHFEQYGLGDVELRITDFAAVRTYRLISDQRWGNFADALETVMKR